MITSAEAVVAWMDREGVQATEAYVEESWQAAEQYVADRCSWVHGTEEQPLAAPASLVMAVNLQTARYLDRRNTPAGVVGLVDGSVGRIAGSDADVQAAMAPYRRVVFG